MMIFYIDDTGEAGSVGFVALGVPAASWRATYDSILQFRRDSAKSDKIPVACEFHATEFIGGRGTAGQAVKYAGRRIEIFENVLRLAAASGGATLLSAFDVRKYEDRLYERLMTRINTCLAEKQCHGIIISDEGKNARFRSLARKLRKYNPIPSRYRVWGDGSESKNIPNDRILEDVIFRGSEECRFTQLVDFCAYALLRFEIAHPTRPMLSEAFRLLDPILNKKAFARDPKGLGIIRG